MVETFIFTFRSSGERHKPLLVCAVFLPSAQVSEQQFRGILQEYLDVEGRIPPDVILLLGTEGLRTQLDDLCNSPIVNSTIPDFTRYSNPPALRAIAQRKDGTFIAVTEESSLFIEPRFLQDLQTNGLYSIVGQRQTILAGHGKSHFVKPSGEHCENFIRTANALISGSETSFIAFWVLRYLRDDLEFIYTDTAGINSLALSAILLKLQNDREYKPPLVDSFSSYEGLASYDFRAPEHSFFLISASTTTGLEHTLKSKLQVPNTQILTVLYLGDEPPSESQILCNISGLLRDELEHFRTFPKDKCPLCMSKVPAVAIGGDQFLIDYPMAEAGIVRYEHAPSWLLRFMKDFRGKEVLRVHRLVAIGEDRPRELFIDLAKVCSNVPDPHPFKESEFLQRLDRQLLHIIPATLKHIVYANDPSSKALAQRVSTISDQHFNAGQMSLAPHTELPKEKIEGSKWGTGTLMVVGGIMVTGQKLMEINQLLRNRSDDSVIYLAGITKTRNRERLTEIRTNIQYGKEGSKHYPFYSVLDIHLPDDQISRPSPWDLEADTWRRLQERPSYNDPQAWNKSNDWVTSRIAFLEKQKVTGLSDSLFLPDAKGHQLQLRHGFAFWPDFRAGVPYSQADVYFTVAAVLHSWRQSNEKRHPAVGAQRRVLISPRNFYRYNDGVIQACLLRAADMGEMDYRIDDHLGAAMAEVLSVVFSNIDNVQGEAALEFLLAIAQRRLSLAKHLLTDQLDALEKSLTPQSSITALIAKQLCLFILKQLETERF